MTIIHRATTMPRAERAADWWSRQMHRHAYQAKAFALLAEKAAPGSSGQVGLKLLEIETKTEAKDEEE